MVYQKRQIKKLRPVPKNCPFCNNNTEPEFRDTETLAKYISERGKILAHTRTGLCSRHQRAVTLAIKQARHLSLLPFVNR